MDERQIIIRQVYSRTDAQGRQEMRYYTHRRIDVYMMGVLTMGFTAVFLGALYLQRSEWPTLIVSVLGTQLMSWCWRRFWYYHGILKYMNEFEKSL